MTLATLVSPRSACGLGATDRLVSCCPAEWAPKQRAASASSILRNATARASAGGPGLSTVLLSCSPILWISTPQSLRPEWAERAGMSARARSQPLGTLGRLCAKTARARKSRRQLPLTRRRSLCLAPTNSPPPKRFDWHVWVSPCHHPVVGPCDGGQITVRGSGTWRTTGDQTTVE
jgi:hypothetical protein